ncbi:MAG: deoxyribodipyrimidine photo-lyase/cryptochrome family protein [Verrucomicrobiota bacterium]
MIVLWFKKDLRLHDHPALCAAVDAAHANQCPLLCLYIYEDQVIHAEDFSRRHLVFINDCLAELQASLREIGQELWTARGEVVEIMHRLHQNYPILHIFSHQETGNAITYRRDIQVKEWGQKQKIAWQELPQNGVVRCLRTRDGWARQWASRMRQELLDVPEKFPQVPQGLDQLLDRSLRSPVSFDLSSDGERQLQRGGSRPAFELLDSFLQRRGKHFTRDMSSPVTAYDACSRLSPYFTYGAISVREAYQLGCDRKLDLKVMKAEKSMPAADLKLWNSALRSFLGRLRWHCHFIQKLEDEPELENRNLFRACDGIRENEWNDKYYQAWCEGKTGYPIVDACMRALRATGWINFRMRAMLMSFSSYHLWLHWRKTGLHLARLFTDYEPGIHWPQVQMQSGTTGINSIRIYSPAKQAIDQDPQGIFIRQWVPELQEMPDCYLAEPWNAPAMEQKMNHCLIGIHYSQPVVDHATAYAAAQRRIRASRSPQKARQERQRIYQKHGSRKR